MKKLINTVIIVLSILSINSCTFNNKFKEIIIVKESNLLKKNITVKGMTCVGCEVTLEGELLKIKGVVNVKASHNEDKAFITFDSTKTNLKIIKNVIRKAGYKSY